MIHLIDNTKNSVWGEVCAAIGQHKLSQISFYKDEICDDKDIVLMLGCPKNLQDDVNNSFNNIDFMDFVSSVYLEEALKLKEKKYNLIIIPFLGMMSVIDHHEQEKILRILMNYMAPFGKLIFDIETPDMQVMLCDPSTIFFENEINAFNDNDSMIIQTQRDYQEYTQTIELKVFAEILDHLGIVKRKIMHQINTRYTFRWEMHNLIILCGLKVEDIFGGYDRIDFNEQSSNMIWVTKHK